MIVFDVFQGRAVPTPATQQSSELYTHCPIHIDWLGPEPPSVDDVSADRYDYTPTHTIV